ncbi:hypothetical protein RUND412_005123 [Rhizina undulata]
MRSERRQVLYMKNLITFLFMLFLYFCILAGVIVYYFATKGTQGNDMLSGETVMIVGIHLVIPMGVCTINVWEQLGKLRREWRKGLNGYREE